MTFGMPSLVGFDTIQENVDFAKENGLEFVELNMDLPYSQNMDDLDSYNFKFTMHVSEEINVADLNENLREAYLNEAIRQIMLGVKNHIDRYTIHIDSGVYFTLPDGKFFLNEKYSDIYKDHFDKSCEVLEKIAEENNIMINFENTKIQGFTLLAVEVIKKYPHLGFTLDLGHNAKNGDKAYPLFYPTGKIRHIHMHDTDGKSDHLAIGSGNIDFSKYKDLLENNYVVIEVKVKEELLQSIETIKKEF